MILFNTGRIRSKFHGTNMHEWLFGRIICVIYIRSCIHNVFVYWMEHHEMFLHECTCRLQGIHVIASVHDIVPISPYFRTRVEWYLYLQYSCEESRRRGKHRKISLEVMQWRLHDDDNCHTCM